MFIPIFTRTVQKQEVKIPFSWKGADINENESDEEQLLKSTSSFTSSWSDPHFILTLVLFVLSFDYIPDYTYTIIHTYDYERKSTKNWQRRGIPFMPSNTTYSNTITESQSHEWSERTILKQCANYSQSIDPDIFGTYTSTSRSSEVVKTEQVWIVCAIITSTVVFT